MGEGGQTNYYKMAEGGSKKISGPPPLYFFKCNSSNMSMGQGPSISGELAVDRQELGNLMPIVTSFVGLAFATKGILYNTDLGEINL